MRAQGVYGIETKVLETPIGNREEMYKDKVFLVTILAITQSQSKYAWLYKFTWLCMLQPNPLLVKRPTDGY